MSKWIEIKKGCEMPESCRDVQIFVDGNVTSGYHVSSTSPGWMEYNAQGNRRLQTFALATNGEPARNGNEKRHNPGHSDLCAWYLSLYRTSR